MALKSLTANIARQGRLPHPALLTITGNNRASMRRGMPCRNKYLRFRIREELLREAGLANGQLVDILFDKTTGVGVIAPSKHGLALVRRNIIHAEVRLMYDENCGLPFYRRQTGMEDIKVKGGAIHFRIQAYQPKQKRKTQDKPSAA